MSKGFAGCDSPGGEGGAETVGMPIQSALDSELTLVCLRCDHRWLRRTLARIPGTCPRCCSPYWNRPRKRPEPLKTRLPAQPQARVLSLCPLSRRQSLEVAAAMIQGLRGYRKNPEYRTLQNDLHYLGQVLERVSIGERENLARPTEL